MPDQSYAEKTAAAWIKPGGGYDQYKKDDPAREKQLPVGGTAGPGFMPIGNSTPPEGSQQYKPQAGRADKHASNVPGSK